MTEIYDYIEQGDWYDLFSASEQGHLLTFYYNLIKWLERDKADELLLTSIEFLWKRQGKVMGRFPITIPEPSPSFREMLLLIRQRDNVINKYIVPDTHDESIFHLKYN